MAFCVIFRRNCEFLGILFFGLILRFTCLLFYRIFLGILWHFGILFFGLILRFTCLLFYRIFLGILWHFGILFFGLIFRGFLWLKITDLGGGRKGGREGDYRGRDGGMDGGGYITLIWIWDLLPNSDNFHDNFPDKNKIQISSYNFPDKIKIQISSYNFPDKIKIQISSWQISWQFLGIHFGILFSCLILRFTRLYFYLIFLGILCHFPEELWIFRNLFWNFIFLSNFTVYSSLFLPDFPWHFVSFSGGIVNF